MKWGDIDIVSGVRGPIESHAYSDTYTATEFSIGDTTTKLIARTHTRYNITDFIGNATYGVVQESIDWMVRG